QQDRLMDSRGRSCDQQVEDEAGRQQTRRGVSETERVGGDERLTLRVGGEESGVRKRNRESLPPIREKGQRDVESLLARDADPRMKSWTDQNDRIDELGVPRRQCHG